MTSREPRDHVGEAPPEQTARGRTVDGSGVSEGTALVGKEALERSVGDARYFADWTNPRHRARRLVAEFIGMFGLTFVLSGGAAILARYGGAEMPLWQVAFALSAVSALWLVVAVFFLGDISAHFNPAMTFAFTLRRDMGWVMCLVYWLVQLGAGAAGSFTARAFFGIAGNLGATQPQPGQAWQATLFEAMIAFGLVLMVLSMANGPKLSGAFIPLAVGAYIMAWGAMGGPYEGSSMNPARSFGPDLARGDMSTLWVYLVGPMVGAAAAVAVARFLRGPSTAQEARAAQGVPLGRDA